MNLIVNQQSLKRVCNDMTLDIKLITNKLIREAVGIYLD